MPGTTQAADVRIRSIGPTDASLIRQLCDNASPESSRLRFHCRNRHLSTQEVAYLAGVDHVRRQGFGAFDEGRLVGMIHVDRIGRDRQAEISLLVEDDWQRRGVGRQLLSRGIEWARQQGIRMLVAEVLPENMPMLRLLESIGWRQIANPIGGCLRTTIFLDTPDWMRQCGGI